MPACGEGLWMPTLWALKGIGLCAGGWQILLGLWFKSFHTVWLNSNAIISKGFNLQVMPYTTLKEFNLQVMPYTTLQEFNVQSMPYETYWISGSGQETTGVAYLTNKSVIVTGNMGLHVLWNYGDIWSAYLCQGCDENMVCLAWMVLPAILSRGETVKWVWGNKGQTGGCKGHLT